jgi:hypothetical protein
MMKDYTTTSSAPTTNKNKKSNGFFKDCCQMLPIIFLALMRTQEMCPYCGFDPCRCGKRD